MAAIIGFILSILCGFLPMFFLAGVIYWLDRYEKEPVLLLGAVFGWGAVVAVLGALAAEVMLGQSVLAMTGSKMVEEVIGSTLFAPVIEEIVKGLAVLLVFVLFRHEFDSILDGIVYASVAALGFAATEDALYYFSGYLHRGIGGLAFLVVLRFVIFGWQHAFFTAFTGIGLAISRLNRSLAVKTVAPFAGLAMAMAAHSLHNALLTFLRGFAGLAAAAIVAWAGWLAMFAFILYLIYRERSWLVEYLREEVEMKTITAEQYRQASSFFGQTLARFGALSRGRYRSTDRFFQLCGELSHKKRQLATLGEERDNRQRVEMLRAELGKISMVI